MQRKPGVECFIHSQNDVTSVQFKTFRFITLRKLIKLPEKLVQGFFSVVITKVCRRKWGEGLASGSV